MEKTDGQNIFLVRDRAMPRHMKYTGVRKEQYQAVKENRSNVSREAYRALIVTLNKREVKALTDKAKRETARANREMVIENERLRQQAIADAEREVRREEARVARNTKRREKTRLARLAREAKAIDSRVVIDIKTNPIVGDESKLILSQIEEACDKLVGLKHAYVQFSINGEIVSSLFIQKLIGGDGSAIFYNNIYRFVIPRGTDSIYNIFNSHPDKTPLNPTDNLRFVILKADELPSVAIQQKFRDGVKHCVLDPLYNLWLSYSKNSESIGSKKRCLQIANSLKKMELVYPDGVPDGLEMETIARMAKRSIIIHDILGKEVKAYYKECPKNFRFTNTRLNHLESGFLTLDGDYQRITQEEMNTLIYEHDRDDIFYLYGGDICIKMNRDDLYDGNCRSLRSVRGAYAVYNEDYEIYKEFSKSIGLDNYGVNAVKLPELNAFIKESRIINSAPTPLCDSPDDIDGDDVKHIDLEKAYTQHKSCKFYKGFLGHINEWCKLGNELDGFCVPAKKLKIEDACNCETPNLIKIVINNRWCLSCGKWEWENHTDSCVSCGEWECKCLWNKSYVTDSKSFLESHVGIFQFVVLSCADELLTKLGIKVNEKFTLPSPEIEYFMSLGVTIKLLAGCWGSTFDFDYTPIMLEKEKRRYATWAGKQGMDNDCTTYTFKGDRMWASVLNDMLGSDNVLYFGESNMIIVMIPKKSYLTRHHILSFITSYTRINMLDTMKAIDGDLIKVVLDGIYFRGEVPDVSLPYRDDKEKIKHGRNDGTLYGFREHWYYPSTIDCSDWNMKSNFDIPTGFVKNVIVLSGAGGTGKSHSVLENKAIPNVLYVVPTHSLGRKMRKKTGCIYTTIHKLIGCKLGKNGEEKCRMYKETNGEPADIFIDEGTMIEASWIDRAIALYPNSRIFIAIDADKKQWFQCRNGYTGNFSKIWLPTDKHHVIEYTTDYRAKDCPKLQKLKVDIRNEMKRVFTDGGNTDTIRMNMYIKSVCKTVPFADAVASFVKGDVWIAGTKKTNEKLLEAGIVSGYASKIDKSIVTEGDLGDSYEKRGSFTTHSFQGLTLETERVFISLDFFEYAMLYTSISRVCKFSQLVIVA